MRLLALTLLLAPALVAGCGGGDDSSSTAATGARAPSAASGPTQPHGETTAGAAKAASQVAAAKVELGSPSEVPRTKGGDNSIQDFGDEAGAAERAAAARVLTAYLRAYANGDTETACVLLASGVTQLIERGFGQAAARGQGGGAPPKGCPDTLKAMAAGISSQAARQIARARVLSLRIDGGRAFAIYVGAAKQAYAMPMVRESGGWKIGAVAGTPLL